MTRSSHSTSLSPMAPELPILMNPRKSACPASLIFPVFPRQTLMDAGTGDSNEVAPEGPQPTHINVHIHKESALAKILLTGCSLLRLPASATSATSRLLVASWVRGLLAL